MDEATARQFLADHQQGVLVTIRGDGRPQSSNIVYHFDGEVARVSVTDGRAKTANLRRDRRALLHVIGDTFWQYLSASGAAELSPLTATPGDATGRELLSLYNGTASEPHPDPAEFFAAMVEDRRLVLTFRPDSFAGMV